MDEAPLDFKIPPQHAQGNPHEQIFYRGRNSYSSGLDYDDDTTSANGSLSSGNEPESDAGDNDSTQISLRGPKIRFHSRAPWEMDDVPEGDESDHSRRSNNAAMKPGRKKAFKTDTLIRTFTRGSRPSVESSYSLTTTSKVPPEFSPGTSSRRSLSLAQEPLSNRQGSGRSLPTSPSAVFRNPWHMSAGGCALPNDHPTPRENPSSTTCLQHTASTPYTTQVSPSSSGPRSPSVTPSIPRASHDSVSPVDFIHPYANPDLVIPQTSRPQDSPRQPDFTNIGRSDSISTVTESVSSKSTVFPVMSRDELPNVFDPKDTQSGHRIRKREISSPTPLQGDSAYLDRNTKFLSLHPPPPYMGPVQPHSPTVALISLQEAQARERSRTTTYHATAVRSSNLDSTSRVYSPDPDDGVSIPESRNDPDSNLRPSRSRTMSISVGSLAKTTLHSLVGGVLPQPERRSSEACVSGAMPARRVLKHKKSGFMRLFGVRGEGDRSPPPPVPSLSDTHLGQNFQTKLSMTSSKVSLSMSSVTRTSLAGLEESAANSTTLTSDIDASSEEDQDLTCDPKCLAGSRKRLPPPLYIATGLSNPLSPFPSSERQILSRTPAANPRSASLSPANVPQSAPPAGSNFQGLKLRPASALFSAHFGDFVVNSDTNGSLDSCATSPTVNSGVMLSPLTPDSSRPSDDEPRPAVKILGEQSLAVEALQGRFLAAKKVWQTQIWELEGRIRDLQTEIADLRAADDKEYCEVCRRGDPQKQLKIDESRKKLGVLDRPRARTSDAARFSSGNND